MDLRQEILGRVKPFRDNSEQIIYNQDTEDIIISILRMHEQEKREYDKFCLLFDEPTAYDTGEKIWIFLKENVRYKVETEAYQTVRTPAAIVAKGQSVDCKNYSLFTAGILDGLNRRGAGIPFCYRFASYDFWDKSFKHVFVVMYPDSDEEIWIDAVLGRYDDHKKPCYQKDIVMLAKVSGIGNTPTVRNTRRRQTMGQGDGDDGDDIYLPNEDDNVPDPTSSIDPSITSQNTSGDDTGFTFSSTAVSAASQAGEDITDNPQDATDQGSDAQYQAESISETATSDNANNQANLNQATGNSFTSWLSNLLGGGGTSGGSTTSMPASTSNVTATGNQQPTTTNPYYYPPSTTPNNNTALYIAGGIAVFAIIIALTNKSK